MPKDPPSSRSLVSPKLRGTPYPRSGRGVSQGSSSEKGGESSGKDWEELTCPICMEYPHNAVLLLCSSYDKGCRPYMCDTSYRHSNCLDQYRKAKTANVKNSERDSEVSSIGSMLPGDPANVLEMADLLRLRSRFGHPAFRREGAAGPIVAMHSRLEAERAAVGSRGLVTGLTVLPGLENRTSDAESLTDTIVTRGGSGLGLEDDAGAVRGAFLDDPSGEVADLLCPLCRGKVFGWNVVEPARHQLNQKPRGCAQEACSFTGTYKELREHARAIHPTARPSDIDPARQRDWRRLERQRDLGDVLSTIRSAMPGASVLGDYVIDDDEEHEDEEDETDFPGDDGNWWTVFLLFQVFGPSASFGGLRGLPGRMSRITRGPAGSSLVRGALWGEHFQGSGINNLNENSVDVEGSIGGSSSRRRRSRPRSRGNILY